MKLGGGIMGMTRIVKGNFSIGVTVPGVTVAQPLFFAHPEALVGYGPVLVTSSRYSNHYHWSAGDISIDINRNNLVTVRSNRDACYEMIHLAISNIQFSGRSIISGVKLLSSNLTEQPLQPTAAATASSIGISFAPRRKFHVVRGEAKFQIYTLTACSSGSNDHVIPRDRTSRDVTAPLYSNGENGSRILLLSDRA
jgi:hypothetical protein